MEHCLAGTQGGDSCGNSTSPRTPQRVFFTSEEAEAVPAESVRLKWKPVKHDIWINFEKQPKTNGEDSSRKNLTDSFHFFLLFLLHSFLVFHKLFFIF